MATYDFARPPPVRRRRARYLGFWHFLHRCVSPPRHRVPCAVHPVRLRYACPGRPVAFANGEYAASGPCPGMENGTTPSYPVLGFGCPRARHVRKSQRVASAAANHRSTAAALVLWGTGTNGEYPTGPRVIDECDARCWNARMRGLVLFVVERSRKRSRDTLNGRCHGLRVLSAVMSCVVGGS